jgi:hypothetical protein
MMPLVNCKPFIFLGASVLALIGVLVPVSFAAPPIIADHSVVEKYADIPPAWIAEVKKMRLNVPGESHSLGYRLGLELLAGNNSTYAANATEAGPPEAYTTTHLRVDRLKSPTCSANNWGNTGTGEEDWYTNTAGINGIKASINCSNDGSYDISAIGFGWCWDMTWHNGLGGTIDPVHQTRWAGASVGGPNGDLRWGLDAASQAHTGNSINMDTYLNATVDYMNHVASRGYPTKVFFTTGPIESANTGELGYQKYLKHKHIRDHVYAHDGYILFDYADILSYNDAGTQKTATWTDYGGTLRIFPTIADNNMLDMGGSYSEDGDHIGERGAVRLAKAMWWMLARIAGWDGVPVGGDTIAPTVSSTAPANGATNINPTTAVTATFSEAVTESTVNATTFTLKAGVSSVPGTVTLAGTTATFWPSAAIAASTTCTATITTGVNDLAGNAIAANYTWSFTTAAVADTIPPTVTSTNPPGNQAGVAVNGSVSATFSEAVATASVTTTSFTVGGVVGTVSVNGNTATFTPSASLAYGTTYTATITTAVTDIASNHLAANYFWSFTTGTALDSTPPTVTDTTPATNASSVPVNTTVTAAFSEPVTTSTVSTSSFTLKDSDGTSVTGAVILAGTVVTFTPSTLLVRGAMYTAAISTAVKDLAGNSIAAPYSWSFVTENLSPVDTDGDGISDATDAYPDDPTRATFPTTYGTGNVTVDASGNGPAVLRNVRAIADTDPSLNNTGKPSGFVFPDGMVSYEVQGVAQGTTVTVRITFPTSPPAGSRIYKVTPSGYNEFTGAVINGNTVTLLLTDGGAGDSDGSANGIISDLVGVAAPVPGPGSSSSGGGCSVTRGSGDPGDFSGVFGALGYATLVLFLRARRKGKKV